MIEGGLTPPGKVLSWFVIREVIVVRVPRGRLGAPLVLSTEWFQV